MNIFEDRESAVRSYCRRWPTVFDRATGSWLYDEDGRPYLDFFAGAGALNYGHNNPTLKRALRDYLDADRVMHSLDMHTVAKREFLIALTDLILRPRDLDYRVQFPGPAGTTAVEAALKLARKFTGRTEIICFSNAFHGVTLGALAVTGSDYHRRGAGVTMTMATRLPFDHPPEGQAPDTAWFEMLLEHSGCGPIEPAAAIVETVQGEGGVNVARPQWLRGLADWCRQRDMLLIVDDVQMGCGRTGPFFSFESAGIEPDIVCVSKSISGYGLPLALTLLRQDLDIWQPGEHNGTFRGVDPAFVTGTAALSTYWCDDALEHCTQKNGQRIHRALAEICDSVPGCDIQTRGRGLVHGLAFDNGELAEKVAEAAFRQGLLVETAGPLGEVVKLMPPLTVSDDELERGLAILADAVLALC
ncbi:MAG TPA: diaminobutyrate--2-oxoglutarate transaminase [Acidimicrobiales bacterium]|nr:diaminobutyrate--2-oxoglutarate transaminase [Acidimicrobiales bacterium]